MVSTTERVVKPASAPNWSLQPDVTWKSPHVAGVTRPVWLAGFPETVNWQAVGVAEYVSILKLQVHELSSELHERLRDSMVHSAAAIIDLLSGLGAGAARAEAAKTVLMMAVVKCMMKLLQFTRVNNRREMNCRLIKACFVSVV